MFTTTLTHEHPVWPAQQFERLSDAVLLKLAWEHNAPWSRGSVVVLDDDGYIVPSPEIAYGKACKEHEIRNAAEYLGLSIQQ
jgi:hypothetical protein